MRLLAVLIALSPSVSFASDLNHPVWAVRAEILKGSNAADSCASDVNALITPEDYVKCIRRQHDVNRQFMGANHEAFDAGLFYRERQMLQSVVSGAGAAQSYFDYVQMSLDRADAHYAVARDEIGATDDQVKCDAVTAGTRSDACP
jgi:hypothetical protein